tara:strand:- start:409 stop:564 length:156 start_codon:yes stop_codon:yes gene_type:complete
LLKPYIEELTVFIKVKIEILNELSNSTPLKVSKKVNNNSDKINIITDKKYL